MTEWLCPVCGGGFPSDALLDGGACPWCKYMLGEGADDRRLGRWRNE
jgi:hypothetical protein